MQSDLDDKQCAESPKQDADEMLFDDVFPQMFFDDMFFCCGYEPHNEEADDGENEVHPIFVKDIELRVGGFLISVLMLEHAES